MHLWKDRASQRRVRRLNSRQLKKYRLGVHQELGCQLTVNFAAPLKGDDYGRWLDALCELALEHDVLLGGFVAGTAATQTSGYVAAERGSLDLARAQGLASAVAAMPEVASANAGELSDAWYGWSRA